MRTPRSIQCILIVLTTACSSAWCAAAQTDGPLPIGIVGLRDSKVARLLAEIPKHADVKLVGIVEQNAGTLAAYKSQFPLDSVPIFSTINELMEKQHPGALLLYTAPVQYRRIIQDASAYGVSVMVERPIATSLDDALVIRHFVQMHRGVQLLVDYESNWSPSHHEAIEEASHDQFGELRSVVVRRGTQGARPHGETSAATNGMGDLYDSGLYSAALLTVLMHGHTPVSVSAQSEAVKPGGQLPVNGGAGLVVRYAGTEVFLQSSNNSSSTLSNIEIHGRKGYAITIDKDHLRVKYPGQDDESTISAPSLTSPNDSALHSLEAAMGGNVDAEHSLGGMETNLVAMQIVEAARESAKTGRPVMIHPLPSN